MVGIEEGEFDRLAKAILPSAAARGLFWNDGRGGMKEFASEPDRQIIGVVADSRDNGLNQEPGPKMFVPQAQIPDLVNALNTRISPMSWVIRTKVSPLSLGAPAQTQLRQATGPPVADIRSMSVGTFAATARVTRLGPADCEPAELEEAEDGD